MTLGARQGRAFAWRLAIKSTLLKGVATFIFSTRLYEVLYIINAVLLSCASATFTVHCDWRGCVAEAGTSSVPCPLLSLLLSSLRKRKRTSTQDRQKKKRADAESNNKCFYAHSPSKSTFLHTIILKPRLGASLHLAEFKIRPFVGILRCLALQE